MRPSVYLANTHDSAPQLRSEEPLNSTCHRDGEVAAYAFVDAGELDSKLIPRLTKPVRASPTVRSDDRFSRPEQGVAKTRSTIYEI